VKTRRLHDLRGATTRAFEGIERRLVEARTLMPTGLALQGKLTRLKRDFTDLYDRAIAALKFKARKRSK